MDKKTEALKLALEAGFDEAGSSTDEYYEAGIENIVRLVELVKHKALAEQTAQQQGLQDLWHKAWPKAGAFVRASADDLTRFAQAVSFAPQPAQQEIDELTAQRDKLADILTRTANALKGQPAALSTHSWHDLPEVAQQLKAAQQQEPVQAVPRGWRSALQKLAFMARTSGGTTGHDAGLVEAIETAEALLSLPYLYTSPPAPKPWVGLSDEDIQEVRESCGITHYAIKTIEAKLKEKNT